MAQSKKSPSRRESSSRRESPSKRKLSEVALDWITDTTESDASTEAGAAETPPGIAADPSTIIKEKRETPVAEEAVVEEEPEVSAAEDSATIEKTPVFDPEKSSSIVGKSTEASAHKGTDSTTKSEPEESRNETLNTMSTPDASTPMEVGVLVHYLGSITRDYIRLFDLVAGGLLPYYNPDLNVLNAALNTEFSRRLAELRSLSSDDRIELTVPYDRLEIQVVRETWFTQVRPRVKMQEFTIQMAYQAATSTILPREALVFGHHIKALIDDYELCKYRFEAERFRKYLQRQKESSNAKDALDKEFNVDFIEDNDIRIVLVQYFEEFTVSHFSDGIRAPIIIAGAIIEALLTEAVRRDLEKAKVAYTRIKGNKKSPDEWRFEEVIDVALEIGILPKELEKQTDMLCFRNYIHVHLAAKSGIQLDGHYKELCKNALLIIVKQVRAWYTEHVSSTADADETPDAEGNST